MYNLCFTVMDNEEDPKRTKHIFVILKLHQNLRRNSDPVKLV